MLTIAQTTPARLWKMVGMLLPSPVTHSGWRRIWEIASDLLIATALVWTLPLLVGAVSAVVRLFRP